MISDLNKVNLDEINLPSLEKLSEVIRITDDEIFTLKRRIEKENTYFSKYLNVSAKSLSRLAMFFSSSRPIFLNEILKVKRTYLEIFIDLIWIYKHYKNDSELGENLAKRFFQIGADNYSKDSYDLKKNVENDIFLRNIIHKLSIDADIKAAQEKKIIKLCDPSQSNKIKGIQNINWQAIPSLINTDKDLKKLTFKGKVEEIIPLSVKLFNHKNPAYLNDYKNLNYFTHWSSFHYMDLDDEVEEMIFLRELNFCVCYLHDTLNILYDYLGIFAPERIACLRQEFVYLS